MHNATNVQLTLNSLVPVQTNRVQRSSLNDTCNTRLEVDALDAMYMCLFYRVFPQIIPRDNAIRFVKCLRLHFVFSLLFSDMKLD